MAKQAVRPGPGATEGTDEGEIVADAPPAPAVTPATPDKKQGDTPARVLRDCWLGKAGDIVLLAKSTAEAAYGAGYVDLHPAALREVKDGPANA